MQNALLNGNVNKKNELFMLHEINLHEQNLSSDNYSSTDSSNHSEQHWKCYIASVTVIVIMIVIQVVINAMDVAVCNHCVGYVCLYMFMIPWLHRLIGKYVAFDILSLCYYVQDSVFRATFCAFAGK